MSKFERLEVRELVLVDGDGNQRGVLAASDDGAYLELTNRRGDMSVQVSVDEDNRASVQFCREDGTVQVELSTDEDECNLSFALPDSDRVWLRTDHQTTRLELRDAQGHVVFRQPE